MQAVIRVCFPDGHTLETTFHPSETIQSLVDLLIKVVAQPDLQFHLCNVFKFYTSNIIIEETRHILKLML